MFAARLPDSAVQVRLHFQTTAGSWEPDGPLVVRLHYAMLTSYNYDSARRWLRTPLRTDHAAERSRVVDWLQASGVNHDGILGSDDLRMHSIAAIADVQEIGFVPFGRIEEAIASGVALTERGRHVRPHELRDTGGVGIPAASCRPVGQDCSLRDHRRSGQ